MTNDLQLGIDGDADGARRALSTTAAEVDKLARRADNLGDQFRQAARDAAELDTALAATRVEAAALAKEFSKASSPEARKSLRGQIEENRKAATELKRLRADIIGDTEVDAKKATGAWQAAFGALSRDSAKARAAAAKAALDSRKLIASAGKDVQGLADSILGAAGAIPGLGRLASNPYALTAGVAAVTTIGPPAGALVGAAAGGALGAGAAVGAVGLGVAGVADNEKVQAAWSKTIEQIKREWKDASQPFVGPTVDAAKTFGQVVANAHLDTTLQKASTYLAPLVEGAAGFTSNLIEGVNALVNEAGPEVEALRTSLPGLGEDVGKSFKLVAGGAEGGADGLRDIIRFAGIAAIAVGVLVRAAEDVWHGLSTARETTGEWIHEFHQGLSDINPALGATVALADTVANAFNSDQTTHSLQQIQHGADDATFSFNGLTVAQYNTADAAKAAQAAFDSLFNTQLAVDQANLAVKQGWADLNKELSTGKRTLDENTQAGRDNSAAILDQIGKLKAKRDADIAAGNGTKEATDKANAAYRSNIETLRGLLVKLGYTKAEVDALIGAYNNLAKPRTAVFTTIFRQQGTPSESRATGNSRLGGNDRGRYGAIRMAMGGAVVNPSSPGTFLFGEPETGGEAFIPLRGISQDRAMDLAQVVGDRYGFNVVSASGARGLADRVTGGRRGAGATRVVMPLPPDNILKQALGSIILELHQTGHL